MEINNGNPWSNFLVDVDKFCEKVPVISTFTNLFDMSLKACLHKQKIGETEPFYSHIKKKSTGRCIALTVPIFGNLGVFIYDKYRQHEKIKEMKKNEIKETGKNIIKETGKNIIKEMKENIDKAFNIIKTDTSSKNIDSHKYINCLVNKNAFQAVSKKLIEEFNSNAKPGSVDSIEQLQKNFTLLCNAFKEEIEDTPTDPQPTDSLTTDTILSVIISGSKNCSDAEFGKFIDRLQKDLKNYDNNSQEWKDVYGEGNRRFKSSEGYFLSKIAEPIKYLKTLAEAGKAV